MSVLPQWERLLIGQYNANVGSMVINCRTIFVFTRGFTVRLCPVHANSAFRCVIIQSNLPSRWTTTKDVIFDFVDINAV